MSPPKSLHRIYSARANPTNRRNLTSLPSQGKGHTFEIVSGAPLLMLVVSIVEMDQDTRVVQVYFRELMTVPIDDSDIPFVMRYVTMVKSMLVTHAKVSNMGKLVSRSDLLIPFPGTNLRQYDFRLASGIGESASGFRTIDDGRLRTERRAPSRTPETSWHFAVYASRPRSTSGCQ